MSNISNSTTITPGNKNIVDMAAANGSFKTFGKALQLAGLADKLRGTGPFTLFAPTDAAFDKLPAGKLDALMKPENKDELTAILNYHVLAGRSSAADVGKQKTMMTVNGKSVPVVLSGKTISIDGAEITTPDIASSNGILHGIDKVNIPTRH